MPNSQKQRLLYLIVNNKNVCNRNTKYFALLSTVNLLGCSVTVFVCCLSSSHGSFSFQTLYSTASHSHSRTQWWGFVICFKNDWTSLKEGSIHLRCIWFAAYRQNVVWLYASTAGQKEVLCVLLASLLLVRVYFITGAIPCVWRLE